MLNNAPHSEIVAAADIKINKLLFVCILPKTLGSTLFYICTCMFKSSKFNHQRFFPSDKKSTLACANNMDSFIFISTHNINLPFAGACCYCHFSCPIVVVVPSGSENFSELVARGAIVDVDSQQFQLFL